jgi:hypothetical protein
VHDCRGSGAHLTSASTSQAPFQAGDSSCFRRLYLSFERIHAFRNVGGMTQPNFLRSLLETYGADDDSRLPLGTVLSCVRDYRSLCVTVGT